jgi:hypothetical protein
MIIILQVDMDVIHVVAKNKGISRLSCPERVNWRHHGTAATVNINNSLVLI